MVLFHPEGSKCFGKRHKIKCTGKSRNNQAFVHPSVRGRLNCTSGRNRPSRGNSRDKTRRRTPLGTVAGPGRTGGLARCRRLCLRHPAYAQSPRKCSNIEILAKIEGKEAKFFSKIYEGHIRICFRSKKNSKLSHACVPLNCPFKGYVVEIQNVLIINNRTKNGVNNKQHLTQGLQWELVGKGGVWIFLGRPLGPNCPVMGLVMSLIGLVKWWGGSRATQYSSTGPSLQNNISSIKFCYIQFLVCENIWENDVCCIKKYIFTDL